MVEKRKSKDDNNIIKEERGRLPYDILFEILARVPANSLLRFKSVCKLWLNIISDPNFIEFHFQLQVSKLMMIAFKKHGGQNFYSLNLQVGNTKAEKFASLPIQQSSVNHQLFKFRAACDGLILFEDKQNAQDDRIQLCVYNSKTCTHKFLPRLSDQSCINRIMPCLRHMGLEIPYCYALVRHDASTQTYKVVAISTQSGNLRTCTFSMEQRMGDDGVWRKSRPAFRQNLEEYYTRIKSFSYVARKGVLHWIAYTKEHTFIESWNIATEKFMDMIELPYQPEYNYLLGDYVLLEINGILHLMHPHISDSFQIWGPHRPTRSFETWGLKDLVSSTWIKRHEIKASWSGPYGEKALAGLSKNTIAECT